MRLEFGEEFFGGGIGGGAESFDRAIANQGSRFRRMFDIRRFAARPAMRDGGEEGTIGFKHETIDGRRREAVAHGLGIFERENASKAHEPASLKDAFHGFDILREAMENGANFPDERLHDFHGFVERIARVNDAAEAQFGGQFQLLLKDRALFCSRLGAFIAGGAKKIQTSFPDGGDFRMFRQFAQSLSNIDWRFVQVIGMPSDGGENIGKLFRDRYGFAICGVIGSNRDDFSDGSFMRARDDLWQVAVESVKTEVGVRVIKNSHRRRSSSYGGLPGAI